ncbi:helix-turn-helix domain-containing protein [Novosphingobium sp.]|uniref:helix-turn-helix domain-containing protein n=1 Tax=Novosphingobium sp. TaxID=1874826 RepID=UPI002FDAA116
MPTPLAAFRKRFLLSVEDLAERIGVPETQVKKWERRWEDIPPENLRDIAVIYGVSVSSILGEECPVEEWGKYPFAISEAEPLYGTLRLTFSEGKEADFPVSQKARESILTQLGERCFTMSSSTPGTEPWLQFWTMDDRMVLARLSHVKEIALLSDDERQAPYHAHPEVYRWLGKLWYGEEEEEQPVGPALRGALGRHYAELGGRTVAQQQATHALLVFTDGRELAVSCNMPNEASAFFALDLSSESIPNCAFLQIEDNYDYHEAYFVNIDALRLISVPAEAYLRNTGPDAEAEAGANDDDD